VLSLIAGIIYLVVALIIFAIAIVISSLPSVWGISDARAVLVVEGSVGLLSGIIMTAGSFLMNSENRSRVRTGAILVLIFTIVGALFTVGGFVLGFVLGLVGSILGLVWRPPLEISPPPAYTV